VAFDALITYTRAVVDVVLHKYNASIIPMFEMEVKHYLLNPIKTYKKMIFFTKIKLLIHPLTLFTYTEK